MALATHWISTKALVVPDPSKTLKNGAIDPFSKPSFSDWQDDLFRFAERHGISIGKRYRELTASERKLLWEGDPERQYFSGHPQLLRRTQALEIQAPHPRLHPPLPEPDPLHRLQRRETEARIAGRKASGGKNIAEVSISDHRTVKWMKGLRAHRRGTQNRHTKFSVRSSAAFYSWTK